ncbi:glycosyl hydrolase family 76-domain-containing protein [Chytriomyces sp. MP71]|nr:glycosyl hydrolase family 76-domain-containing protein [Chytriomyces sp. MP71]
MQSLAILVSAAMAVHAQQNIDLTSKDAVVAAAKAAMWPLKMHYDANKESSGAWLENYDAKHWLIQWHESGEYWGFFYTYMQYSGDQSYLDWVDHNMQLSVGGNSDFLDGQNPLLEIAGRWNDDIAWWALSTMTAAEVFGTSGIVAPHELQAGFNPTYFSLSNTTFHEIWMSWDDTTCGGGLFWSRARNSGSDRDRYLKSVITNVEEMELGARLFAMTGDASYQPKVDKIYAWLKSSGVLAADYTIYDSVDSRYCTPSVNEIYSYHYGPLLSAMASMYRATKDTKYLTEGNALVGAVKRQFAAADNSLSIEPSCGASGCAKSPHGYSWPVYKGLAAFHAVAQDIGVKEDIAAMLRASGKVNFKGCDTNWYCIRDMPPGTPFTMTNGTNPRDQFETVSLLNALAVVNGASLDMSGNTKPGDATVVATATSSKKAGASMGSLISGLVSMAACLLAL